MPRAFARLAFTPDVISVQTQQGSDRTYEKFTAGDGPLIGQVLTDTESDFIEARDGFYQATVSQTGWPYVQFRGGPAGFLKVLDETTIAYADFRGNRQYISTGNLLGNNRISLILMDYPNRRRLKILGEVSVIEEADAPDLIKSLHTPDYKARPERAFIIRIKGFDWNCPQHIPQRLTIEELADHLSPVRAELTRLRSENASLRQALKQQKD